MEGKGLLLFTVPLLGFRLFMQANSLTFSCSCCGYGSALGRVALFRLL